MTCPLTPTLTQYSPWGTLWNYDFTEYARHERVKVLGRQLDRMSITTTTGKVETVILTDNIILLIESLPFIAAIFWLCA
jgi:hypothetical protein